MSTADFGSTGNMKNATIHVGSINCYDNLYVEDDMNVDGNVTLTGKVVCRDGIQIGDTLFDENTLKNGSTVNGILSTWPGEPTTKKLRIDSVQDTTGNSYCDVNDASLTSTVDSSAKDDFVKVNGLASQNAIVTPTGVLVQTGDTSKAHKRSFMLPEAVGTDNLITNTIHSFSGGSDSVLDIHADTVKMNKIAGKDTANGLIVDSEAKFNKGIDNLKVNGTLTVTGDTTLGGNLTFDPTTVDQNSVITFPGTLEVNVVKYNTSTSTGTGSSSNTMDELKTNKISTNTSKVIEVASPVSGVEIVVGTEKNVSWNTASPNHYRFYRDGEVAGTTDMKNAVTELKKLESNPGITEDQYNYICLSRGIYSNSNYFIPTYLSIFAPESCINLALRDIGSSPNIVVTAMSDEQFSFYNDYLRAGNMASEMYTKCYKDRKFFVKLLYWLQYNIQNMGEITGFNTIVIDETHNTATFKLKANMNGYFTDFMIDLSTFTATYSKNGTTYDRGTYSNGITDISNDKYDPDLETLKNLIEYMVVYEFMYQHTATLYIPATQQYVEKSYLRKTSDNTDYISNLKARVNSVGTLPENIIPDLSAYITWWKEDHEKQDWERILWTTISNFIDSIPWDDRQNIATHMTGSYMDTVWPKWLTWQTEEKNLNNATIEYRRSSDHSSMYIYGNAQASSTVTVSLESIIRDNNGPYYPNLSVGNLNGNTSVNGTLNVTNITGNNGKSIEINSANFKQIFINGNELTASPSNITSNMGVNLQDVTLYPNKCLDHTAQDTNTTTVKVDLNYIGVVYFITIRPIIIEEDKITKYCPASTTATGFGNIRLFNDNTTRLNPYGFDTVKRDGTFPSNVIANPADLSQKIAIPIDSNLYNVGTAKWERILCYTEDDGTGTTVQKQIRTAGGTANYFMRQSCGQCVAIDWIYDKSLEKTVTLTTGQTKVKEYVYLGGISFTAHLRNNSENSIYYSNQK